MSEVSQEQLNAAIQSALQQAQTQAQAAVAPTPAANLMMPQAQPMGMPGMMPATQMMGAAPQPTGLLVAISLPMPDGSEMSAYLQFPVAVMQNPHALQQIAMTYPVRTFQPRGQWGGGNGGGYGGGYRNGGGGFRGGRRW